MSTRRKTPICLGAVAATAAGTFAPTTSTTSPSIHIGDHVEIQVQR